MTAPAIRHRDDCPDPTLRQSQVPLDRTRTRWYCLGCHAETVAPTDGPEARHRIKLWAEADGHAAACTCGWRTHRRTRDLRDRDADAHQIEATELRGQSDPAAMVRATTTDDRAIR